MTRVGRPASASKLESSDVVAEIGADENARSGECDQIAVNRRAVEGNRRESIRQLGMADRVVEAGKLAENDNPRKSGPQAALDQQLAKIRIVD